MTATQPNPLDAAKMTLADQAKLAATDFKAYVQMMATLGPDRLRSALMGAGVGLIPTPKPSWGDQERER